MLVPHAAREFWAEVFSVPALFTDIAKEWINVTQVHLDLCQSPRESDENDANLRSVSCDSHLVCMAPILVVLP